MTTLKLWILVTFLLSVTTSTLVKGSCENFNGSCLRCTSNPDCLYCETSGMCVSTEDMSQHYTCSNGFRKFCKWCKVTMLIWLGSCSAYNDLGCEQCSQDRRCGWCSSSSTCEERPLLGNHRSKPTCSQSLMTRAENCPTRNQQDNEIIPESLKATSPSSSASVSPSRSPGLDSNSTVPAESNCSCNYF